MAKDHIFCDTSDSAAAGKQLAHLIMKGKLAAEHTGTIAFLTLHCKLQLENTFDDPDIGVPDAQLERLVIERNISAEQLDAGQLEGAPGPDEREDAQLTMNGPQLLEKPVPARANPMARLHESGRRAAAGHAFRRPASHAHVRASACMAPADASTPEAVCSACVPARTRTSYYLVMHSMYGDQG